MLVRPATLADALAIAAIHVASWQAAYRGIMSDGLLANLSVDQRRQMWENRLVEPADKAQGIFVCELDQRMVGFASFGRVRDTDLDPATVGEVYAVYALSDTWGRGAGRALWLRLLDELRATSFKSVTLWVLTDNSRGRRFYECAGFTPDGGVKSIVVTGENLAEIRYRRALP
jgi:GNAT superfamily N-acetyltransferase